MSTASLTEDYNLELQYRKPFLEIWEDEKNDRELGPLSERMGVRHRNTCDLNMTEEEKEAVSEFDPGVSTCMRFANHYRLLPCILLLQGLASGEHFYFFYLIYHLFKLESQLYIIKIDESNIPLPFGLDPCRL